jgi:hypothetical protein
MAMNKRHFVKTWSALLDIPHCIATDIMTFLGLLLIEYHYNLILVWVVFLFKSAVCLTKIMLHKISSILCKMFWNALYFQRFTIKSVQHYIIRYFTAVQISHLLHRTLYHITQGGDLLQIKKKTGCLCATAKSTTVHCTHRTFNYAYIMLLYFTPNELCKSLSYCKCIQFYYVWHILVHSFPDNSSLPAKTYRSILRHWAQWLRIALSKGSTRLDDFLYLKTEAELYSKTWYCIKFNMMDKTKRKKITSLRHIPLSGAQRVELDRQCLKLLLQYIANS